MKIINLQECSHGKKRVIGGILTLLAAIMWAFSGTCSQYLFENFDVDPVYLTAARLLSSGIILLAYGLLFKIKDIKEMLTDKSSVIRLICFAIFGVGAVQLTYLVAIGYSNSGTATILQYVSPVMVMVTCCVLERKRPKLKEVIALIFAICGVVVITTHFDFSTMSISKQALIWGLLSAVALACSSLIPVKLIEKFSSAVVSGLAMVIAGIVLSLCVGLWNAPIISDYRCLLAFLGIVFLGTVIPFTIFYIGILCIGPVRASLLSTIEPLASTVFMIIWLGASFDYVYDTIGFILIISTVFLLTKKE